MKEIINMELQRIVNQHCNNIETFNHTLDELYNIIGIKYLAVNIHYLDGIVLYNKQTTGMLYSFNEETNLCNIAKNQNIIRYFKGTSVFDNYCQYYYKNICVTAITKYNTWEFTK